MVAIERTKNAQVGEVVLRLCGHFRGLKPVEPFLEPGWGLGGNGDEMIGDVE